MESEFVEIARQFLFMVSQEVDPYVSEKSFVKVNGNDVTLFTPEHFQFARYGRGPGKQPPINKILDFVKKKGIIFDNSTQRGTAWAIAKSIAKNGTKGYVPNAPDALQEALDKHLQDYAKELSEQLTEIATRETKNIYVKRFPVKDKFKI